MRSRKMLAIPASALLVILAACGGGGGGGGGAGGQQSGQSAQLPASATNPQSRDAIADGGELRIAKEEFGGIWNPLSVSGNNADTSDMLGSILPRMFRWNDKGDPTPNPDYLTGVNGDKTNPQVVTYDINPKAVWGSGRKIDYTDFAANWQACGSSNTKFQCATRKGYSDIKSVTQGSSPQQVVVTYKGTYPDWTSTFDWLLPKEGVKDPDTFNNGWNDIVAIKNWLSGPFTVGGYDKTQKTFTQVPNPQWWGDKPKLAKITYKAISQDSQASAFANNEIDSFEIGVDADAYRRAQQVADGEVRKAQGPDFRHFTVNSKAGNLTDKVVRQAISKGLNRQLIANSDLAGLNEPVTPLGNHIFVQSQTGYQDNAKATGMDYNPDQANKDLDAAGWTKGADGYRAKNGKTLEVDFSQLAGIKVSQNEALQVQNQLKAIGIKVNVVTTPIAKFQDSSVLTQHQFQIIAFSWIGTPYPYDALDQIYKSGAESNFAQLTTPGLDDLITKIDSETDKTKRIQMANEADKLLWENVHTIALYQRPQNTATKKKLANFGSFGLSIYPNWTDVGFMK